MTVKTKRILVSVFSALVLAAICFPVRAAVEDKKPLANVVADSTDIIVAEVVRLSPARPAAVLTVKQRLRGQRTPERLTIKLEGESPQQSNSILARLPEGASLVLFLLIDDKGAYLGSGFVEGTWFQLNGVPAGDGVAWSFQYCLPYMRGAFCGTTHDLVQLLRDGLADKSRFPAYDAAARPGLGPPAALGDAPPVTDPRFDDDVPLLAAAQPATLTADVDNPPQAEQTRAAATSSSGLSPLVRYWRPALFLAACLFVGLLLAWVGMAPRAQPQ